MGYFGSDLTRIETNWNDEFTGNVDEKVNLKESIIWNYETAPSLESNRVNLVSKHCTIPFDPSIKATNNRYFSFDYSNHFNQ